MKYKINFNNNRVLKNISGPMAFKSELDNKTNSPKFKIIKKSRSSMFRLANRLDSFSYDHDSIFDFLLDSEISCGNRRYNEQEISRAINSSKKTINAILVGFPFKCEVPIKTNYHQAPDLGEIMFLIRLGKICKEIGQNTQYNLRITILEETDALRNIFGTKDKDYSSFRDALNNIINSFGFEDVLEIKSLANLIFPADEYDLRFDSKFKEIDNTLNDYEELISQLLPTIALSVPHNDKSLEESSKYIYSFFKNEIDLKNHPRLKKCLIGYLTFLEVQKESNYKDKLYNKYLQLSLNPKKGRLAIRPTVRSANLLPHHGVPLVVKNNSSFDFQIVYFMDLINSDKIHLIREVRDENDQFMYYVLNN